MIHIDEVDDERIDVVLAHFDEQITKELVSGNHFSAARCPTRNLQEYGFNPILTLINFASDKGLIKGVNPNRYFESNTDVKFDTRMTLLIQGHTTSNIMLFYEDDLG